MKSIFLVETPLGYLNALEAQSFFKINPKDSLLIFVTPWKTNIEILLNILDKKSWGEIHSLYFDLQNKKINQLKRGKIYDLLYFKLALLKLNKVLSKHRRINFLISSYYTHEMSLHSVNLTSYTEFVLVDDGAMSIATNENRKNEYKYAFKKTLKYNGRIKFGKSLVFKYILGLKDSGAKNVTFFSTYKFHTFFTDSHYLNNLSLLKGKIINRKIGDEVFYLGSPLTNSLPIAIDENSFEILIEEILNIYGTENFVYIPHRNESTTILRSLQKKYNFKVRNLEVPIEYYFTKTKKLPRVIISCFSSALFNLAGILPNEICIESIYIPESILVDNWNKQNIIRCYEEIEKISRIKITDIKW